MKDFLIGIGIVIIGTPAFLVLLFLAILEFALNNLIPVSLIIILVLVLVKNGCM